MEYAIVVAAEVRDGTGILADEPVTTATLRTASGGEDRVVRIAGGPTKRGGYARLAGHVVPILGARVRVDLHEEPTPALPISTAWSWVPNTPAGTWDTSKLPLTFDLASPVSRDLGDDAGGELEVAARTWGRPACTAFRARFGGMNAPLTAADDGINGVYFHDDVWPAELVPNALAQTIVHLDGNGKLRDADIHINGAAFRFSRNATAGTQDIRGIFVHEIGHALGLGHSTDPRATMNLTGSGLRWRSLEKDDVDGVCALYPGIGSSGCDADPCPSGFLCVAGACQHAGDRAAVCSPCTPELGACEAAGDDARCVTLDAGSVCGRACATDNECGSGFACRATTEAGDLQCVSLDGCKNGANLCANDADCASANAVCRAGACVVATPVLPGADAGATADAGTRQVGGGGNDCACHAGAPRNASSGGAVAGAIALLFVARRRRVPLR